MGAAKRKKEAGYMPEQTLKPRSEAKIKVDYRDRLVGVDFMSTLLMTSMLLRRGRMRNALMQVSRGDEEHATNQ